MSTRVNEYCETFERFRTQKESDALPPQVEDLFEDELSELWNTMSVEECREVESRYPELRVRRF